MTLISDLLSGIGGRQPRSIARAISLVEDNAAGCDELLAGLDRQLIDAATVIGITGPPGAGKSTLTDQLVRHLRHEGRRIGVIAIDPSSALSGGAVLGDRVRMMDHAVDPDVIIRSMASRGRLGGLCAAAGAVARVLAAAGCSPVLIETVGVGQLEMDIVRLADITALVLAPGLGDEIQAMKAGLLEVADLFVVNKADNPAAQTLAMELEAVAHSAAGEWAPSVVLTVASRGDGVAELAGQLAALNERHIASGRRGMRREQAARLETQDWLLELLRPRLAQLIDQQECVPDEEPRQRASRLLDIL